MDEGHQLRRPEADLLRDKIYELRASLNGIHYIVLAVFIRLLPYESEEFFQVLNSKYRTTFFCSLSRRYELTEY